MTKWDKIFRIAVVLLLSANLAVNSIICVRLSDAAPTENGGKNAVEDTAEDTVKGTAEYTTEAAAKDTTKDTAKAPSKGTVEDIAINGGTVSTTDYLIECLKEYTSTDKFADREKLFTDKFGTPGKPFTVTRVIDLKADDLGQSRMSIHYLLVKADWQYAADDDFSDDNILIVVNYDTGEVLDQFMADESWLEDTESVDYWNYMMLNGPLHGSAYDGGVIVIDSETRTELPESEIVKINEAIQK